MRIYLNNSLVDNMLQGSLSISNRANGERSLNISLYDVLQRFVRDGDEIEVFEGSFGTTKLFGGIISSYSSKFITPITDQYPLFQVDLSSEGYNVIASRRVVNLYYTDTNIRQIVLDMLSSNNLGAELILTGTITVASELPAITYIAKYKTIAEVLDDLASSCGHVWFIDNSRRLHFTKPQGLSNAPYQINTFDGTFTDFSGLSWSGGLDNYCNKVFVAGDFNGSPLIKEVSSEIAERASEADGQGTGVYGMVIEDSNIKSQFQANLVADNHLRTYAVSPGKLTFSTYTSGFAPNQRLQVRVPQITGYDPVPPYLPAVWHYLIDEVTIDREDANVTKYTISATRRNSGDFSTQKSAGYKEFFKKIVQG